MKVQSWRYLIAAVAFLIATPVYVLYLVAQRDSFLAIGGVVLFVGALKLLYISLSEEKYQEEKKRVAEERRISREIFGSLAPVASRFWAILPLFALGAAWLLDSPWPAVLLLLLALAYSIWLRRAVNRRRERTANPETPPDDSPQS